MIARHGMPAYDIINKGDVPLQDFVMKVFTPIPGASFR